MKRIIILKVLLIFLLRIANAQSILINPIRPLTYCAGSPIKISFNASGFSAASTFTAELSDTNGVFNNSAVSIGSTTSLPGNIQGTISNNQMPGTGYRIRVRVGTAYFSSSNDSDIAITSNNLPNISPTASPLSICAGSSAQIISGVARTNFKIDSIPYNRIPVPADALDGPFGDDELTDDINLPFSFNFYGPAYTKFKIATNGNVQFGESDYDDFEAISFLNITSTTVNNFVALCWGDQVLQWGGLAPEGRIKYFIYGTAPNRRMVIDWEDCGWYDQGNGYFSGQIQLYENNIIEFHLKASIGFACCAGENNYKTMGVLNADATIGNAPPGRDRGLWEVDSTHPEAWRFTPPGFYDYSWSNAGSLDSTNKDTVIATPSSTTTYNVSATNQLTGCVAHGSVTVVVNPIVSPAVTISSSSSGTTVTFIANPVNGGASPTYNWFVNGIFQGSGPSPFTIYNLSSGDTVYCEMTSSADCLTSATAISNTIGLTLPLTLIDFNARALAGLVKTGWQTLSEYNSSHFNVQRSSDGIVFESVGTVKAAGISSEKLNYTFNDVKPNTGINYYRLQMIDKDGKFTFSKVVSVNLTSNETLSVYPVPVKNILHVEVKREKSSKAVLQVMDVLGRIVIQQNINMQAGLNAFSISTSDLSKGTYILVIKGENTPQKRFVKQ